MVLDTEAFQTRNSETMHALVKTTTTGVLELKRLHGRLLEFFWATATFMGSSRVKARAASTPSTGTFNGFEAEWLWQSCRDELRCRRGIMPLLLTESGWRWSREVHISLGILSGKLPVELSRSERSWTSEGTSSV